MKVIYYVSMILSLVVSADQFDTQYDQKVVRHVDGLVKAMEFAFSKTVDKEFDNASPDDEIKKDIKAEFNDHVLKPFRKDALRIVQEETDAFKATRSLKKRNAEGAGHRFQLGKIFSSAKASIGKIHSGLLKSFNDAVKTEGSILFNHGFNRKAAITAALLLLSYSAIFYFFTGCFVRKDDEEI